MDLEEKDQVFSDYDEQDSGDIKPLPNFIPPEAQKVPAAPAAAPADQVADQVAVESTGQQPDIEDVPADAEITQNPVASTAEGAVLSPTVQQIDAAPDAGVDVVTKIETEAVKDPERERSDEHIEDVQAEDVSSESKVEIGDKVILDRATYEAIMGVAKTMSAAVQQGGVTPIAGPIHGQQQMRTGTQALADGGMSLLGGAAVLTGAALSAVGKVASSLAGALREHDGNEAQKAQEAHAAGVTVLPRISEYRVDQAEKAASAYENAMQKLWESGNLPNVRREIEERARQTGLSVEDVMDKMKPNGEMSDLYEKFCAAVAESPDAQTSKKAMDKALDGWMRQYGRGQEELLNPETEGNPHFESLRDRLDNSHRRMLKNTANVPLFEDEDKSHAEKLHETIQRIMEKIKEIAKDFVNMIRGKKGADMEANNAPSP
jgi:predicted transcriptional regulator